jgi:hypothetical protein
MVNTKYCRRLWILLKSLKTLQVVRNKFTERAHIIVIHNCCYWRKDLVAMMMMMMTVFLGVAPCNIVEMY